ncbi:MAG TPA: HAD family phosphatase [Trebonia sp.]|nr:HAD family phosphatase [Trebonia sp.]
MARPSELRAVLFDLDGVLIDTEAAVLSLWRRIVDQQGVAVTEQALRDQVLGYAPEHSVDSLLGRLAPQGREAVLDEIRSAEKGLGFEISPGASVLLRALLAAHVPLALVTGASRERVARVSQSLPELRSFEALVTWGEPARGKPHPDPYLLAAERLGVHPGHCAVVEDAPSGVRSAVAAGAPCIGIASGADGAALRLSGAAAVVPALSEISVRPAAQGRVELLVAGTVMSIIHGCTRRKEAAAWR